jgi:uncharacterized membrane protein YidH (DUF202 family)
LVAYIRNLILIAVGFYVVNYILQTLLTGESEAEELFATLVPIMIAIGGAIYAVIGALRMTKVNKGEE